jgi:hypothetical protein
VDFADLMALPCIEKNALGRSRLAGIDVRHDANVTVMLERSRPWHICKLFVVTFIARDSPNERNIGQQKRGWTRRSLEQEPVSIRHRRVYPLLVHGWGPKARRVANDEARGLDVKLWCYDSFGAPTLSTH